MEQLKMSRRKGRRMRREAKRLKKKQIRCDMLGNLDDVFCYHDLYRAGKACCNNVRWKHSVQRFEARLLSGTALRRRDVVRHNYEFSAYVHFMLCERGKIRPIDAPRITDRQVEKLYTRKVLLPLYLPEMIWNNGASLPGKGFAFSIQRLKKELREHYRKYGRSGGIILTDGQKFFPNAEHKKIYDRHNELILNDDLRSFGDNILHTISGDIGMPLGVEPSQAEMIAYPSKMDNYMKCQMGLKGYGHYMDDFYALVPPDRDWREVLLAMRKQAERCGVRLNPGKTRFVPLTKAFRFCKVKYLLTETGKIIVRANRQTMCRDRKKLRAFHAKIMAGAMEWMDLWASVQSMAAHLRQYDEHKNLLRLRRLFYHLFGFSCESIDNFKRRSEQNAVHCSTAV